jgi:sugar phosphate isomerase/epimerase
VTTTNPPAVQLYTFRELLPGSRASVLAQIAAFGYGAVELYDVLTDTEGQRADLTAAGLRVSSVHAVPSGDQAEPIAAAVRTLGTDTIIVPHMPPARFADADSVAALAAELNEMATWAAGHGLRLGYHNHDFELSSLIAGRTALEVLADQLQDGIVLEVDTYWAAVGGQDVPELLGRLGDRVRYLHVKDGPIVNREDFMTAVGSGKMPVAQVLAAAPAAEWHIVELDRCATDMMTAVGDSLAWLIAQGLAEPAAAQRGAS